MASQHVLRHPASQRAGQQAHGGSLKERIAPLVHFWQKLSNDWIFNLAGLLAYNFLMSIFPILLALLAIAGFILNAVSPGSEQQLVNAIAGALPGGASGTGGVIVKVALTNLQRQAGVLFVVGLVLSTDPRQAPFPGRVRRANPDGARGSAGNSGEGEHL